MSYPCDCNGCASGHHEHHNRDERRADGVIGVIGGTYCPCIGDCGERFTAFAEHLSEILGGASVGEDPE